MGRRSKSDELGLSERIVDMHDAQKMTHQEISQQFKGEGLDVSREAVRRSYQNSMKAAGKYKVAAESCKQIIASVKDGSNLDMVEAANSIITGMIYEKIMSTEDLDLSKPEDLLKALKSAGDTQVRISQFKLNFDKGVQKAKATIYDELAEKLSDMPEVLETIAKVISEVKVTE